MHNIKPTGYEARLSRLSRRERSVLEAVATGMSNREVATQLSIAPNTVVNALTSVYSKLDLSATCNARVSAVLVYLSAMGYLYTAPVND